MCGPQGFHPQIHPKSSSPKKSRRSFVQRIIASAREDKKGSNIANQVCIYGRYLSEIESELNGRHHTKSLLETAMKYKEVAAVPVNVPGKKKNKTVPFIKVLRQKLKESEARIAARFFKAIDEDDAETIIEIAQAVIFLKDKRPRPIGEKQYCEDRDRASILMAKEILNMRGEKWTVKEVAQYLEGRIDIETPEDGFSALRRKCRQLGFPLAKASQIKRKDPLEFLRNFARLG